MILKTNESFSNLCYRILMGTYNQLPLFEGEAEKKAMVKFIEEFFWNQGDKNRPITKEDKAKEGSRVGTMLLHPPTQEILVHDTYVEIFCRLPVSARIDYFMNSLRSVLSRKYNFLFPNKIDHIWEGYLITSFPEMDEHGYGDDSKEKYLDHLQKKKEDSFVISSMTEEELMKLKQVPESLITVAVFFTYKIKEKIYLKETPLEIQLQKAGILLKIRENIAYEEDQTGTVTKLKTKLGSLFCVNYNYLQGNSSIIPSVLCILTADPFSHDYPKMLKIIRQDFEKNNILFLSPQQTDTFVSAIIAKLQNVQISKMILDLMPKQSEEENVAYTDA